MNRSEQPGPVKCVRIKQNGERCGNWPMHGGTLCAKHGGKAPQIKRAAERRLAVASAGRMVELSGVDMDPLDHLLDSLHRAATLMHVWGIMVAALDDASAGDGLRGALAYELSADEDTGRLIVSTSEQLLAFNASGLAQVHPFVVEYEHALERRAKLAKMCLDAGVSERQIRLVERLAEQLSTMFNRSMAAIEGLTAAQRAMAAAAYAREIGLLERPVIEGTAA